MAAGYDRVFKLVAARGPNTAAEASQQRIPASAKKGLRR